MHAEDQSENLKERDQFGRPRRRWDNNVEMYFKEQTKVMYNDNLSNDFIFKFIKVTRDTPPQVK